MPSPILSSHNNLMESLQNDDVGYQKVASILLRLTGINMPVNDKNKALMAARLVSVLSARNLGTYSQYARVLEREEPDDLREFTENLTTNKTEFFRESRHFEIMTQELPRILSENAASGRRELRVWCAAASTGQEPYTIAMTLLESVPDIAQWSLKFLATDIDTQVLKKAASGIYTERELDGLSPEQLETYFQHANDGSASRRANVKLRGMISFAQFNLMTDPFPFEHRFDIVFCRNVLIYFDRDTSSSVIKRLAGAIRPGGILFLGHTETGIPKPDYLGQIAVAAYKCNRSF